MAKKRVPVTHELKFMGADLCDAVYNGVKPFEIRKNDRDYHVGDLIKPVSINESGECIHHPIDNVHYVITFMVDSWPIALNEEYCVFGIKRADLKTYVLHHEGNFCDHESELWTNEEVRITKCGGVWVGNSFIRCDCWVTSMEETKGKIPDKCVACADADTNKNRRT